MPGGSGGSAGQIMTPPSGSGGGGPAGAAGAAGSEPGGNGGGGAAGSAGWAGSGGYTGGSGGGEAGSGGIGGSAGSTGGTGNIGGNAGSAGTAGGAGTAGAGGIAGGAGSAGTGGGTGGSAGLDASVDVGPDSLPPQDAGFDGNDIFDALPPLPDSGPIAECVNCLQTECNSQINTCYNDPNCVQGVQCAITQCTGMGGGGSGGGGGGQLDFACILQCFNNDMGSVMTAVSAFQCITMTCGDACGLSGGGGSGGGNGGWPPQPFAPSAPLFGPSNYYIGSTRVPRPEEVVSAYPWLADVLEGRLPEPLPPCLRK